MLSKHGKRKQLSGTFEKQATWTIVSTSLVPSRPRRFRMDVTADVTCQACRENLPIALGSKPPLVTRIARTVLGTRLCIHHSYSLKLHREKERLLTT